MVPDPSAGSVISKASGACVRRAQETLNCRSTDRRTKVRWGCLAMLLPLTSSERPDPQLQSTPSWAHSSAALAAGTFGRGRPQLDASTPRSKVKPGYIAHQKPYASIGLVPIDDE